MCCVISTLLKCLVSIVVSILMTAGVILCVLGALLLWGFDVIIKAVSALQKDLDGFLSALGVKGRAQDVINLMATNASAIGAIAFAVGVILIAIAIVATIAICCCSVRLILMVIVALLIAVTFGLIVLALFYGTNPTGKILTPLLSYIQTGVINKYVNMTASNPESIIVNVVQITVQCCGLYNYSDFNSAPNFIRATQASNGTTINMTFPISCCNYGSGFSITTANLNNCTDNQISERMNNGCWTKVGPTVKTYLSYCFATIGITIGVLIGVIIVLVLFILCLDKVP